VRLASAVHRRAVAAAHRSCACRIGSQRGSAREPCDRSCRAADPLSPFRRCASSKPLLRRPPAAIARSSQYVKTSTPQSAGTSRKVLQQPATERLSERPCRRSPPLCFDQGRVERAARLAALQASKRTGMPQRRLHSTATCQTSRASIRACFPPSPTRHRRSSLPFCRPSAPRLRRPRLTGYPSFKG